VFYLVKLSFDSSKCFFLYQDLGGFKKMKHFPLTFTSQGKESYFPFLIFIPKNGKKLSLK